MLSKNDQEDKHSSLDENPPKMQPWVLGHSFIPLFVHVLRMHSRMPAVCCVGL